MTLSTYFPAPSTMAGTTAGQVGAVPAMLSPLERVAAPSAPKYVTAPATGVKKRHPGKAILSGGIAGGIEICMTYPTEFVKTQMQLYSHMGEKGMIGCAKDVIAKDGVAGLYRGLSPLLYFSVPKAGVRFLAFESYSNMLRDEEGKMTPGKNFLAGLGAGATEAVLVVTPAETIKVKLIHDLLSNAPKDRKYKGFYHGCKTIIAEQGIAGTYKGLTATILKQSTNQAIRFVVFLKLKEMWSEDGKTLTPTQSMAAGAIAGAASVFGNTPIDVVKTRMQGLESHRYNGFVDCVKKIWTQEGVKAFYKGTTPRLARVSADVAIVMTLYEQVNKVLDMVWDTSNY
eukprot:GFYU01009012.1.p2 GENE.GFYU01009012.1~~GFYU01009012.1.p2  ORF type:complete len:342 (-),score=124.74 GFYU01009012.1:151-1176(-)